MTSFILCSFWIKIFFSVGKSRKFEGVERAGKAMTHTLWNGNSREEGGLKQKCSPSGVWIFPEITQFQQYPRESNPGGWPVCKLSISSGEQNYPWENAPAPHSPSACCSRLLFTIFALQRVCSQAMMGWTSKNVLQQRHFSISYLEVNVLQRHVKLPDNLDTSTFKRPQTCKKGISLSLKIEPTFQRNNTLLPYLKQSLLLLY